MESGTGLGGVPPTRSRFPHFFADDPSQLTSACILTGEARAHEGGYRPWCSPGRAGVRSGTRSVNLFLRKELAHVSQLAEWLEHPSAPSVPGQGPAPVRGPRGADVV